MNIAATRVGSIIHGALGDCYEQLVCLKEYKEHNENIELILFFAVENRYRAFRHFNLDFAHEIYTAEQIPNINVDVYYQFQIHDKELQEELICNLSVRIRNKLDMKMNVLPWQLIRKHEFSKSPLELSLSERGIKYLTSIKKILNIDENGIVSKYKIGFLWRYRKKGLIDSFGQFSQETVFSNINSLLGILVEDYNAHIFVCGMNYGALEQLGCYRDIVQEAGLALGERKNNFIDKRFTIPDDSVTYLLGAGYAIELELMSHCDLILTMPSGFSEPLWMMQKQPVVMLFPPLKYLLKLWRRRMNLFNHNTLHGKLFNSFTFHSPSNVIAYLKKRGYLH